MTILPEIQVNSRINGPQLSLYDPSNLPHPRSLFVSWRRLRAAASCRPLAARSSCPGHFHHNQYPGLLSAPWATTSLAHITRLSGGTATPATAARGSRCLTSESRVPLGAPFRCTPGSHHGATEAPGHRSVMTALME